MIKNQFRYCEKFPTGLESELDKSLIKCECWKGYSGDGYTCENINECQTGNPKTAKSLEDLLRPRHECDRYADCADNLGSYTCECIDGFTGDGYICNDLDECGLHMHNCHRANADCNNMEGTYECICHDGYVGNGVACDDIDECAGDIDHCHHHADCKNTQGSFYCECHLGYNGDGFTCIDVDECRLAYATTKSDTSSDKGAEKTTYRREYELCSKNARCENTVGSYSCSCPLGWEGDGFECRDIDECTDIT